MERDQRIVREIREAVFHLHNEGVYPAAKRVEAITRPGYMIYPLVANTWREALKELGFGNASD